MNKKLKWLIGILGASLFAIMAFVGVKFILQAERSASGIESQVPLNKANLNMDNLNLSPSTPIAPAASDTVGINPALQQVASTGKDVAIVKGEFAYRAGRADVEVVLQNQADFPVQAAHISLFLRLNGEKQNVAQETAVPIVLPEILAQGESVRVRVPVSHAAWSAENVAQAQSRQVLAQIVSVQPADDDENANVDYPQTSAAALLKQTANDWTLPDDDTAQPDPNYIEPKTAEAPKAQSAPENHTEAEPEAETDAVQQILDAQKLPEKNEVGVISYEEKTSEK